MCGGQRRYLRSHPPWLSHWELGSDESARLVGTELRDLPAFVFPLLEGQAHIPLSRVYLEDEQTHSIGTLTVSPGPPSL